RALDHGAGPDRSPDAAADPRADMRAADPERHRLEGGPLRAGGPRPCFLAALYGGGLVAWFYGGMGPAIFIARLHEAVSVTHFEVGIIKAPFMALVIGIVACSEGLRVKGSAESLGKQTTTSVVKSIFLVIVLDGLFAVFFASIGM